MSQQKRQHTFAANFYTNNASGMFSPITSRKNKFRRRNVRK